MAGVAAPASASLTGAAAGAGAFRDAAQPAGKLALKALSFAQTSVDASAGGAVATLNWTVTDSNPNATSVSGNVYIRMAGREPGTYTGQTFQVMYALGGAPFGQATTVSGTAQESSYSFDFVVPQYAGATTAKWVVTKVTAQDDQGETLSLSGGRLDRFARTVTATELVDSTPPTFDPNSLSFDPADPQHPFAYVNGRNATVTYDFNVQDPQSGIWKGSLRLQGPRGQSVTSRFAYTVVDQQQSCGLVSGGDDHDLFCAVPVTIPAGSAAGTWTVSQLTVTDNAANTATYRNLNAAPIVVTSDKVIRASGFAATPNPVNNWTQFVHVSVSMKVSGAQQGVTAIYVDPAGGFGCEGFGSTPTVNPDGTVSGPVLMFSGTASCPIAGIAVVDGAGNVALYGPEYGAPDPGVTITRIPDTTPPVATSASLSQASVPSSATGSANIELTVNVAAAVAPVDEISVTLYDAAGNVAGTSFGGTGPVLNGPVTSPLPLSFGMAPGVYTVGFTITDAGRLSKSYGMPGAPPVPGGPVQLTVTP
jgi:hypothetical protein